MWSIGEDAANHCSILPQEPHEKAKDMAPEDEPPGQKVSNMLVRKNRIRLPTSQKEGT